jgi:hypothetical protein
LAKPSTLIRNVGSVFMQTGTVFLQMLSVIPVCEQAARQWNEGCKSYHG